MNQNQLINYALASPQNPSYLFLLKSPQLTATVNNIIDQNNAYLSLDEHPKLQPFLYYHIRYTLVRKTLNTIKILQATPIAKIGSEWNSELFLKHMQDVQGTLKQPEANNPFMKEEMEHGQLRVNDEGWIYVKSFKSGFRKKLKIVNNSFAIPLLKGCKVHFFLRKYAQNQGPKVKISGLEFKKLSLAGILKIINGRIFFQPRHTDYERMIPLSIPQEFMKILYQELPNYRGSLPYNIFKRYNGGDSALINKKFSQFVLRGRFLDWPLKFSHPVIQIQSIQPMNCETLKQATLYQLGIPFIEYDAQQKRLSDQIIQNFNPQALTYRLKVQQRCYSFDCQGGSCFDDAFSFVRTKDGYKVSIHISDVPALVGNKPYLLKQAKQRDQTIYIKNYYRSMFPQNLRDIMSLQEGKSRLTYSLTFQIKDNGVILYDTVQFNKSIIKVDQNITHGQILNKKQDQIILSGLAKALHNCKEIQSLLLFDDIQTAKITSQLLYLSSYLPLVTFYANQSKLASVIRFADQYFSEIIQKAQQIVKQFSLNNKNISQNQQNCHQQEKCQHKAQQLDAQNIEQASLLKLQQKRQFDCNKRVINGQLTRHSESSVEELEDLHQNQNDSSPQNEKKNSLSPHMRAINIQKNQFLRKVTPKQGSAAECFRFLDKLFRAADMKVDFTSPKNIQNAFKYCQKINSDPIAKTYFRTKLIMSKQHFEVIGKLARQGKLKQFQIGNSSFQYPSSPEKHIEQEKEQINQEIIKISLFQISKQKEQSQKIEKLQKQQHKKEENTNKRVQNASQKILQTQKQKKQSQSSQKIQHQHQISLLYNILVWFLKSPVYLQNSRSKDSLINLLSQLQELSKSLKVQLVPKQTDTILQIIDSEISKRLQSHSKIKQSLISFIIKWNTPIRSGTSFQALQLLQKYEWIFKGKLKPSTAILHRKQQQIIVTLIKNILEKRSRQESFQLSGRMKQACRQLAKIDFLFVVRQQPEKIWEFVTITSPSQKVQFVYREFIEEVQVENPQKNVVYYTRVKGRFKGIFEFPIKLKVILQEQQN